MARKRMSGGARRARKNKNKYIELMATKTASISDDLPKDLLKIVGEYLPDIIIDGVPKLEHQVSQANLFDAKRIHFYKTFRLRSETRLINCREISGVPTIVAKSLAYLFAESHIEIANDLEYWDVSNVRNMSYMFNEAPQFNSDLSQWNVSNARDISYMFDEAVQFNSDLSRWNVSNARDIAGMFFNARQFESDLSRWDVSNVQNMACVFDKAVRFNSDLSRWDVSNVQSMFGMFYKAIQFESDLSQWNVSNVQNMSYMFLGATQFESDLSQWNVSNVQNMTGMFRDTKNKNMPQWYTMFHDKRN
jgi:surface protein